MDTVRADHLGCYGHTTATSPNVDRLATHAAVFENAISQSAWTLPAHGSMMTGLYPSRLGVEHYPAKSSLPKVRMLAEELRDSGYATAGFTGGGFVSAHFGFDRGFDVYTSDGRRFEHNIDQAISWLQQNQRRRFFLFLHGYDAHRPYYSAPEDKEAVGLAGKRSIERRGFCVRDRRDKPANIATVLRYYDAAIRHGDRAVGRLLDALHDLDLVQNTIVLVTSDHGEEFFEHGNCDHVRFLYREVVNVPFIMHVPGLTADGRRVKDLAPASISVARTLLELVGVGSGDFPGVSLVPILRGEPSPFRAVYSETDSIPGHLGSRGATVAITGPRFKLISYLEEGSDEGYDVVRDLAERHVLPEGSPVYQQRLTLRAWKSSLVATESPRQPAGKPQRGGADDVVKRRGAAEPKAGAGKPERERDQENLPADVRRQLESLGYLEGE